MHAFIPKETLAGETRSPIIPQSAQKLVNLGLTLLIEKDVSSSIHISDSSYTDLGISVAQDRSTALGGADMILALNHPPLEDIREISRGAILVSMMDPFRNPQLVGALRDGGISALCMELIPRSSYAQKMDVLSSQASLAGYAAVLMAADRIDKALPMMSTPAGTISPAKVLVIGAGVAGLQAIATAKRLGARVEGYDTRPVVEEQVQSLGAKFLKIDVGETGQTDQGYAKALTEEQLDKQRQQMAKFCAGADIIITTAQLFGRPAPRIITEEMVAGMKPGSVVVDLAAGTGGNVAGSQPDEEVTIGGVRILGLTNMPAKVARDASQVFASNLVNLVEHGWDKEAGTFTLDLEDDIIKSTLLTHDGVIRDERVRAVVEEANT